MKKTKIRKYGAIVITLFFLGTILTVPSFTAINEQPNNIIKRIEVFKQETDLIYEKSDYIPYDRYYAPPIDHTLKSQHNDIGYNVDCGDQFNRADVIYVGEIIDRFPGRGRIGYLDPDSDTDDWYEFTVCEGQTITASIDTTEDYDFELVDDDENPIPNGYIAPDSDWYYLHVFSNPGANEGQYEITIILGGQDDAETGDDAGDDIGSASYINPGNYYGYMDSTDTEDWYSFDVNNGEGIFVTIEPEQKTDYDIHLYNPSGEKVHYACYYGDDDLEYPADETGIWKIKIDMFPGYDTNKWPDGYFLYGSGIYRLVLGVGGSANPPPESEPQPNIQPVAKTFIVNNDPDSNKDEYVYLAAVPASNYLENDQRYVSPIVYTGDTTPTHWSGTVDDTTQYLVDDWNGYLDRHAIVAEEYELSDDPITAAADIASENWISSDTAVVVVDGSEFEDTIQSRINRLAFLNAKTKTTHIPADSEDLLDLGDLRAYPMFVGPQWGAIAVHGVGKYFGGDIGITTTRYEALMDDWWPFPNDALGPDTDVIYPVTNMGFFMPYTTSTSGLDEFEITQIRGKRFRIPITKADCSLKVTVTTDEPTYLRIYLIDPFGNVRAPLMPHWNGGPINPLHVWNGGHWSGIGFDDWRAWEPTLATEHVEEVHYPMRGFWRAVIVPADIESANQTYLFNVKAEVRKHSIDRTAAAMSASNAAVIASLEHAPLLYVTKDSVPSETNDVLSQLGVEDIIFVNIDGVSSADLSGSVTELSTMQDVVDYIDDKELNTDNFITITSLGTGDGYFAPSAMIAAYHASPVLNIGEAKDAYNKLDMLTTWREYAGDYYHGCRSVGHLPMMTEEFNMTEFIENVQNQTYPAPGFDLKKRWFLAVNKGIVDFISSYGLNKEGQEAYMFVAPRDTDIRDPICRAMTGNESYAGQIPVETTAFSSALIVRDILYPAIIYANPGRNVTTSQMMNYPDGGTWLGNNGVTYPNYATRVLKETFSSRGRFFEGHCIWDNYLERLNSGASISYYAGHGTGGSGISAQYKNVHEQFPQNELYHDHLMDFDWWDSWRGNSKYDSPKTQTPRDTGSSSYNSQEPGLYDIIHFKYVDESFGNLHSELDFWSSCTTGEHFGPMIYLEHGSAFWYGNCGSGYGIQTTLHDNWMFYDVLVEGKNFGESHSKYLWIFDRDFTTGDPGPMYGVSTFFQGGLSNVHAMYGDPTMICYSPDWIEPIPIEN